MDPTGIVDANKGGISKEDDQGNLIVGSMLSPLPPPLPKSPSESWLWKTLPSIALWHQKKQRSKESETGTKWETIVKTSNVRHDHARYSEVSSSALSWVALFLVYGIMVGLLISNERLTNSSSFYIKKLFKNLVNNITHFFAILLLIGKPKLSDILFFLHDRN